MKWLRFVFGGVVAEFKGWIVIERRLNRGWTHSFAFTGQLPSII